MAEMDDPPRVVVVSYGKTKYTMDTSSMETVGDLKARLAELSNVEMENQKLLHKSRQLSDETLLQDIHLRKRTTMMLIGTQQSQVEELLQTEQKFERREAVLARRGPIAPAPSTSSQPTLFGQLQPLPDSDDLSAPSSAEALALLQRLATDPSIHAIMQKHRWQVGVLKEFAPSLETGIVGVTDSCLLGYNQNKGQVIALRLRTDDFEGFRHYHVIIQTLLHELAHMVHSKHDRNFWALFRQLRAEYDELHWTKTGGRTVSGARPSLPSASHPQQHYRASPPQAARRVDNKAAGDGSQFSGKGQLLGRAGTGTAQVPAAPAAARATTATPAQAARKAALRRIQQQQQQSAEKEGTDVAKSRSEVLAGQPLQGKGSRKDKGDELTPQRKAEIFTTP